MVTLALTEKVNKEGLYIRNADRTRLQYISDGDEKRCKLCSDFLFIGMDRYDF